MVGFKDREENEEGYSLAQALGEVKKGLEQGDIDLLCASRCRQSQRPSAAVALKQAQLTLKSRQATGLGFTQKLWGA